MNSDTRIPLTIGITAHRQIRPEDVKPIRASVRAELLKIKEKYPFSPIRLLCALAEGGDSICAEEALALGIPFTAAIPFEKEKYRKDFEGKALERFDSLLAQADTVLINPAKEKPKENGDNRDYRYRQNGIYVATHCHILIALWDGCEPTVNGCGTASAVSFALKGGYVPETGVAMRSEENTEVIHIFTPRGDVTGAAGEVQYLGDLAAVEDILSRTDDYNRKAGLLPRKAAEPLGGIYAAADSLSCLYADRYKKALGVTAICGTFIALAFLLYDNLDLVGLLIACVLAIGGSALYLRGIKRSRCQELYISYRALAETMRVRDFLRYAGSNISVSSLMNRTQQTEQAWVMLAADALDAKEGPAGEAHDITDCWVKAQRDYHAAAGKKKKGEAFASERTVKIAMLVTAAVYLITLICEVLLIYSRFPNVRTVIKILAGTMSAATLLVSGYYGKQAVSRESIDHAKMEKFYSRMLSLIYYSGQSEEVLRFIAKEELTENGNWCSYKTENKPTLEL